MNESEFLTSACPKCGYTQGRTADNKCPACGTQFDPLVTSHETAKTDGKWGKGGKMWNMAELAMTLDDRLGEKGGDNNAQESETAKPPLERLQRNALKRAFDNLFGKKTCPHCGTAVSGTANFCHQCRHQF